MNNKHLIQKEKDLIVSLYLKGNTYREIKKITGFSQQAIANQVKGMRGPKGALKLAKGKGRLIRSDETKQKLSEIAKRNIIKSKNKIWTKPEREFKKILNELSIGVKFSDDVKEIFNIKDDENPTILFQYPLQRYVCDFVDLENNIVYCINGDFWHANPLLYKKENLTKIQKHNYHHDINRKIFLEGKGFKVIDIWESEINWNKELVISKIQATRKLETPLVLHTRPAGFDPQVAYPEDWSNRIRQLWFKKPRILKKKTKKICPICSSSFEFYEKINRPRIFCSRKCASLNYRKVKERPAKEQILKDLETMSFCAVGRKYNVSDNAIRKWIGIKR